MTKSRWNIADCTMHEARSVLQKDCLMKLWARSIISSTTNQDPSRPKCQSPLLLWRHYSSNTRALYCYVGINPKIPVLFVTMPEHLYSVTLYNNVISSMTRSWSLLGHRCIRIRDPAWLLTLAFRVSTTNETYFCSLISSARSRSSYLVRTISFELSRSLSRSR